MHRSRVCADVGQKVNQPSSRTSFGDCRERLEDTLLGDCGGRIPRFLSGGTGPVDWARRCFVTGVLGTGDAFFFGHSPYGSTAPCHCVTNRVLEQDLNARFVGRTAGPSPQLPVVPSIRASSCPRETSGNSGGGQSSTTYVPACRRWLHNAKRLCQFRTHDHRKPAFSGHFRQFDHTRLRVSPL